MGKLVIGPEGFVDLRRNPPPTTVTVQGYTPEPEGPRKIEVQTLPEPPATKPVETLPAIQKTAEGLQQSVAEPVKVKVHWKKKPYVLKRIESSSGEPCYAIVGVKQYERLGRHHWVGTRGGKMFRVVESATGNRTVLWLHREAIKCNRADRFVAFKDGDERNCHYTNLLMVGSKEEAREIRRLALQSAAVVEVHPQSTNLSKVSS